MNNIFTFKSYLSKVDDHLSFEFYCMKECLKITTQILIEPKPNTLFGLVAGKQQGLNIVESLNCIEHTEDIIIENKEMLISQAKSYILQHLNHTSIVHYAVFDHLRYYTPAKYTHSMIRDLCDNKFIVNLAGLNQSIEDIDEELLFTQVNQDFLTNQNRIIHVDELLSLQ